MGTNGQGLLLKLAVNIRLALEAADELASPLPSAALADDMLNRARELGYAHRDLAALHQVLIESPVV